MTRLLWALVAAAAVAALVADRVLDATSVTTAALIGFGGCALLILGSKEVLARWLQRPEDYYDTLAERASERADG